VFNIGYLDVVPVELYDQNSEKKRFAMGSWHAVSSTEDIVLGKDHSEKPFKKLHS
jgi:hypothetical protein